MRTARTMNSAAARAREREKHPERFCPVFRCTWRTHHADGTWKSDCKLHPPLVRQPVNNTDVVLDAILAEARRKA